MAAVDFGVDSVSQTGEEPVPTNEEVAELAAEHSDVIIPFGSIDPARGAAGVRAARKLVTAGVDVRLGWRAERVATSAGRFRVIGQAAEEFEADAVVVAVPPARAVKLLPAGALADPEALPKLGSSPIVNLHIVYDRSVFDLEFAAAVRLTHLFAKFSHKGLPCLFVSRVERFLN